MQEEIKSLKKAITELKKANNGEEFNDIIDELGTKLNNKLKANCQTLRDVYDQKISYTDIEAITPLGNELYKDGLFDYASVVAAAELSTNKCDESVTNLLKQSLIHVLHLYIKKFLVYKDMSYTKICFDTEAGNRFIVAGVKCITKPDKPIRSGILLNNFKDMYDLGHLSIVIEFDSEDMPCNGLSLIKLSVNTPSDELIPEDEIPF